MSKARNHRRTEILAAWLLGTATTVAGNALATYYRVQQIPNNTAEIKNISAEVSDMKGSLREIKQWIRDQELYANPHGGPRGGQR